MRNKRVFLLTLFLVTSSVSTALACSCSEYLVEPREALQKSALVFSGQVVDVRSIALPRIVFTQDAKGGFVPNQYMERRGIYTFRVIRSWKGETSKEYTVMAGVPLDESLPPGQVLADCDIHFKKGGQYLVFTNPDGYAEANYCAPTGDLSQHAEAVRALDLLRSQAK